MKLVLVTKIKSDIINILIPRVKAKLKPELQKLFTDQITYHINPTGKFVREAGLDVQCVKSGPLGGDAQIASMMVEGKIDMIFFFRDPLGKHPHEPDVQMLLRLCDVHNVPLATNPATAERLIKTLEQI